MMLGQFDLWINDVLWQSQRSNSILEIIGYFLLIDPILFVIGMAGIAYSAITKNKRGALLCLNFYCFI